MTKRTPLVQFLRQPHPFHESPGAYLRDITLISITIFLILSLFRPFGLSVFSGNAAIFLPFAYGAVGWLSMAISLGWVAWLPRVTNEWTAGKEALWTLYQMFMASLGLFLANRYLLNDYLSVPFSFLETFGIIAAAGIIPVALSQVVRRNLALKNRLIEAKELDAIAHAQSDDFSFEDMSLPFPELMVRLPPRSLYFIETDGNYQVFHVYDGNNFIQHRLRITLREVQDRLNGFPEFIRCHRAFIVNLQNVKKVEGNAAGYKITLHSLLPTISVSRKYVPVFREKLKKPVPMPALAG
jgi:hypothetical protein